MLSQHQLIAINWLTRNPLQLIDWYTINWLGTAWSYSSCKGAIGMWHMAQGGDEPKKFENHCGILKKMEWVLEL